MLVNLLPFLLLWSPRPGAYKDSHMEFSAAIPIIRIFSVEKAKEFYLDFLGFTLDWEHRFSEDLPLYAQISRSGLTLHLSEHSATLRPVQRCLFRLAISMPCIGS